MSPSTDVITDEHGYFQHRNGCPLVVIFNSKDAKERSPDKISWEEPVVGVHTYEAAEGKLRAKKPKSDAKAKRPVKFINTSRPKVSDRKNKKTIKVHVGKDGKRRSLELESVFSVEDHASARNGTLCTKLRAASSEKLSVPWDSFSPLDPFALFPVNMEPYMYTLIHRYVCITTEVAKLSDFDSGHDPASKGYLPMAMSDAALFHVILCGTALYQDAAARRRESPEKCKHMSEAVQLLSARLQDPDLELSDSTLIAVAHLADFESSIGKFANWRLHIDGLHKMVQIRGGFDSLESVPKGKIWRADISGCVSTLATPLFTSVDLLDATSSLSFQESDLCEYLSRITMKFAFPAELVNILHELQYLTSTLQNASLNYLIINRFATSIYCHLYSFQSARQCNFRSAVVERTCCIAALFYLKTIYDFHLCLKIPGLSAGGATDNTMIRNLKTCLKISDLNTAETRGLFLWLLFLGGIAVSGMEDRTWFVARIAKAIMEFEILDWDDAKSTLRNFWWVDRIHEDSCRELWDAAMVTVDVLFGGEG